MKGLSISNNVGRFVGEREENLNSSEDRCNPMLTIGMISNGDKIISGIEWGVVGLTFSINIGKISQLVPLRVRRGSDFTRAFGMGFWLWLWGSNKGSKIR